MRGELARLALGLEKDIAALVRQALLHELERLLGEAPPAQAVQRVRSRPRGRTLHRLRIVPEERSPERAPAVTVTEADEAPRDFGQDYDPELESWTV